VSWLVGMLPQAAPVLAQASRTATDGKVIDGTYRRR